MGRPRSRVLVEEAAALTAHELLDRPEVRANLGGAILSMTLASGEAVTVPLASFVAISGRPTPWPPGWARQWFLRCPSCGLRRRALFVTRTQLACRVCCGLRYQSWSERWDFPLIQRMAARREALRHRPGPKGRRFRTWTRRVGRVEATSREWLDRWESKYGEALSEL